jgi:hypothetical protein
MQGNEWNITKTAVWRQLTAEATPANPKKGAYGGHSSDDIAVGEDTAKVLSERIQCASRKQLARSRADIAATHNGQPP